MNGSFVKKWCGIVMLCLMAQCMMGAYIPPVSGGLTNNQTGNVSLALSGTLSVSNLNASGLISGNGAGITNLPPGISSSGNNIVSNSATTYFTKGGVPLILDNQASGATLTGQPWASLQRPIKFIYLGNPFLSAPYTITNVFFSETNFTYIINKMATNGELAAMQLNGGQVGIYLDGSMLGQRNTNWSYIMTNWGTLTTDTNFSSHGIPWMCSVAHSNNIKVYTQFYYATNLNSIGADEWICDGLGNNLRQWTNSNGAYPTVTNNGVQQKYQIVMTPDTAKHDIGELNWWGIDGFIFSDSTAQSTSMNFAQLSYLFGNAAQFIEVPVGYNVATTINVLGIPAYSYSTVDTSTVDLSAPNTYYKPVSQSKYLGHLSPAVTMMMSVGGETRIHSGYLSQQNLSGIFYGNSDQGAGVIALRRTARDFPAQKFSNQGGYIWNFILPTEDSMFVSALLHELICSTYNDNSPGLSSWTTTVQYTTNSTWTGIWGDKDQNWPFLATDYGTNVGSIWATKLSDGSYGVGIFNETTSNFTYTVNWSALGIATNTQYKIVDMTFTIGNYTNSFSTNIAAGAARLLKLSPRLPLYEATNLPIANLAKPVAVTVSGSGVTSTTNAGEVSYTVTSGGSDANNTITTNGNSGVSGFNATLKNVVMGSGAASTANGNGSVVIGGSAKDEGSDVSVAIGYQADGWPGGQSANFVSVGGGAYGGYYSVALGYNARASGGGFNSSCIAIGYLAAALAQNSIAIGSITVSGANSTQIGGLGAGTLSSSQTFRIWNGIANGGFQVDGLTGTFNAPTNLIVGHYRGRTNSPPVITVNVSTSGSGTGATATLDANANDSSGEITLNTGTIVGGGATIFTNTFGMTYTSTPHILFSARNNTAAALNGLTMVYPSAITTTSFIFSVGGTGLTGSSTYVWDYKVEQ